MPVFLYENVCPSLDARAIIFRFVGIKHSEIISLLCDGVVWAYLTISFSSTINMWSLSFSCRNLTLPISVNQETEKGKGHTGIFRRHRLHFSYYDKMKLRTLIIIWCNRSSSSSARLVLSASYTFIVFAFPPFSRLSTHTALDAWADCSVTRQLGITKREGLCSLYHRLNTKRLH